MTRLFLMLCVFSLVFAAGCGEKKADPAKLDQAAKLINNKEYEKGIAMLDDMGQASPSDGVVRAARVDAHMKYANYFMYESSLPPKEKYPSALKQYRLVTEIDPANNEAKQNISLIEGIYSQMGRPIPQ